MKRPIQLQEIRRKRQAILALADRHGAANVRVFGSVARGEAGMESDVDFLVEMRPQHSPWFPSGLRLDLQDLLGWDVDVVTERMLDSDIRPAVLREAIPL